MRRVKAVRAVHPNEGLRVWYEQQLESLIAEAHLDLTLQLSLAVTTLQPRIVTTALGIAMDAPSPKDVEKIMKSWGAKWRQRFNAMSTKIAAGFARRNFRMTDEAMRSALKQSGFTVKFKETRSVIRAYQGVIAENVNLIKSIPQQYLSGVQSAVWSSVNRGSDLATLSRELQKNYKSTTARAALIARDQNAKAKATIEQTRRAELGITQAIWQHVPSKHPRETHEAMHGKVFDLARGMWDPDENQWILPGVLINCRCTSRAILPGLNDA